MHGRARRCEVRELKGQRAYDCSPSCSAGMGPRVCVHIPRAAGLTKEPFAISACRFPRDSDGRDCLHGAILRRAGLMCAVCQNFYACPSLCRNTGTPVHYKLEFGGPQHNRKASKASPICGARRCASLHVAWCLLTGALLFPVERHCLCVCPS